MQGTIFNIQALSIHDGPGIRTTLFLKGCPLHCPWCSNPESMDPAVQIRTSPEKCRGCGRCVDACACGALWKENGHVRFDYGTCTNCLACVEACENGCITKIGTIVSVDDTVERLLRDRPFYENTGGGVTLSGGEPLFQHVFCREVLQRLHGQGVHTAVDTSGFAAREVLDGIIPYVDLFLFDIKHLDRERHRSVTGVDNAVILENLKACTAQTHVWTRTPLVPGFNDDPDLTDAIVDLARDVGAERCCFLPLHRWGEHKYRRIGLADPYEHLREFRPGELDRFRQRYRDQHGFVSFETG
jgi:pyruvate formate lyase activating enzyme